MHSSAATGLVLSGGGARAAYQVGVLQAINEILGKPQVSPFPIVTGTSAGAINSCVIATNSHRFNVGVQRLARVWSNFEPHHVYSTDAKHLSKNLLHWFWRMARPTEQASHPMALLDNSPLRKLLSDVVQFKSIQKNIDKKLLTAICTTAYCYTTGDSVSFYQGQQNLRSWQRFRRRGKADQLTISHLLASAAIPLVFPSEPIEKINYGDGSLRFLAPLSPALHLGARKLMVITVNPFHQESEHHIKIPTIGDISGHLLDSIFLDSLESDIERLVRVNELLHHIDPDDAAQKNLSLKPIDALVLSPSIDPAELAGQYFDELPRGLKFFFRRVGINHDKGESILSYLLFHAPYTQHLMKLGYEDSLDQAANIKEFFLEQG